MCGRYYIDVDEASLREICDAAARAMPDAPLPDTMTLKASGEIYPTNVVPVMTAQGIQPMQWGFSFNGKPIINAREETALDKPMFRKAMFERRCLVPSNGYFEWQKLSAKKQKYFFHLPGRGKLLLAGCWRTEKDLPLPTFVILTRQAVGDLADIHERMPVIIPADLADSWLTEGTMASEQALTELDFEAV